MLTKEFSIKGTVLNCFQYVIRNCFQVAVNLAVRRKPWRKATAFEDIQQSFMLHSVAEEANYKVTFTYELRDLKYRKPTSIAHTTAKAYMLFDASAILQDTIKLCVQGSNGERTSNTHSFFSLKRRAPSIFLARAAKSQSYLL